ncbi:hypothetical protein MAFF211271_16590 [Ralstonia syzygii subsp. indonesiensis]|nr:hypothetical protein MAFF211271_16590 [Ralstonia pseudosolanacearum]
MLLALGIGGSWVGSLTAMEPYRPVFIGLTLLFLGLAFRKLYLVPPTCTPGTPCAEPRTLKRQRLVFWIGRRAVLGCRQCKRVGRPGFVNMRNLTSLRIPAAPPLA